VESVPVVTKSGGGGDDGLSAGAIAGIVIGVLVGVALIGNPHT
jgi:tetrahydromethanopterin S-methyltransferase subunit F